MSCNDRTEQPTLVLPLDTRSPAGSAGRNKWVLVLNANADLSGRMRRFGGLRRFGWEAVAAGAFVNQDLHDQLEGAVGTVPPEVCETPTAVRVIQTGSNASGMVSMAWRKTGGTEPTRVRWYRDGQLIFDSNG